MPRLVDIRSYNLAPGTRAEFHRLVSELAVPLLRHRSIDVVAFGPSTHDDDSYYLIASFSDLADRRDSLGHFYDSDEWRAGPRERLLSLIDSDTSIVMTMESIAIDALRATTPSP